MKKNFFRFIAISILSNSFIFGETNHVSFDINYSPYIGADNLLTLHRRVEKVEDSLFRVPLITNEDFLNPESSDAFSNRSQLGRTLRNIFFWCPLSLSEYVSQHEIFGHGYRARDLGSEFVSVTGYKMYVIGGSTSLDITSKFTTSQNLTIDIAGVEANAIMANRMRVNWLSNNRIDPRQYFLYCFSSLSLTQYSFNKDSSLNNPADTGNDIASYLFYLKATYPETTLTQTQLRNLSLINVLDPFLFHILIAAGNYQKWTVSYPVPMFQIGSVKYLPAVRLGLTPFGVQGFWEHFFQSGDSAPTYAYLKWGKNGANTYYGMGVQNQAVFEWKTGSLGFRADVWHQPDVLFEQGLLSVQEIMELPKGAEIPQLYPDETLRKKHFGGAFSVIGTYGRETWPARVFAEVGYKSAGFLPGEALRQAPIVRGGFSASF